MSKLSALVLLLAASALAADPFSEYVRTVEPLSAQDEAKTFHLPPGFEIQLITHEPHIAKPMNLAFDSRGRLWVSESRTYPFPTKEGERKKDCIKVIELNEDGSARSIRTFADGLDIPIGIYPVTDGSSVIAYDINSIRKFTDTDNDGKADKIELLYSGFGYEDTHGMASNFRRGFDGWVYGTHGFKSVSNVRDLSGNATHLQSGNTYRFRLDGSRFEAFTIGQVNPFGLCFDPLGNMYTSDSHSKPIYQMLRGGRYEAFDRNTDDGLGLAPMMMTHLHGSTAIAGSVFYAAEQFPPEFRGDVFVGNVHTCRINRDKLEYHGSTPRAIEQADFLSTDDPWFRPVNVVLGPDGALYVADFYNRVISHYEVKLDHPGRDYERGRIWRISYRGSHGRQSVIVDISKSSVNELIAKLDDPNLTVRQLASNELSDRIGNNAVAALKSIAQSGSALQRIHACWVLHRLNALPVGLLQQVASDEDDAVRVHGMRILAETHPWLSLHRELAIAGLKDTALAKRCAADALGQHADVAHVRPLLDALASADAQDSHLVYVLRMALRNQLVLADAFAKLAQEELSPVDFKTLADVALAVATPQAAEFLLERVNELSQNGDELTNYLRHAVRYATSPNVEPLARLMQERFADDIELQLELFQSIRAGLEQRGQPLPDAARRWGVSLVSTIFAADAKSRWTSTPLDCSAGITTPWDYEPRRCADGKRVQLLSSLPGGETTTSVLRSPAFVLPAKLSFYLAGHDGYPNTPAKDKNLVRLRLSASDALVAEARPPRNDAAHRIEWDTSAYAGQRAVLELIDADAGDAYAWLGIARIDPPVVKFPRPSPRALQQRLGLAATIAGQMKLADMTEPLRAIVKDPACDTETRIAAATALAALDDPSSVAAMATIVADAAEAMPLRKRIAQAMGPMPAARKAIIASFKLAPAELQTALAQALTSDAAGGEALLAAVEAGKAPPRLLLVKQVNDRLVAAGVANVKARVAKLTRGVAAPKEEIEKLIAQRRAAFSSIPPSALSPQLGEQVFIKNCSACHQIDNKGGLVGPQLAGLAKRGVDRLIEDILDPDRNVDPAFHYSNIFLKDGKVVSGLQKREEGEVLVFVDSQGKEVPVKKSDIQRRFESPGSLMVSNVSEMITPEEFNHLLAYLLTK